MDGNVGFMGAVRDDDLEFDCLSLGDITSFFSLVGEATGKDRSVVCVGHCASMLAKDIGAKGWTCCLPQQYDPYESAPSDSVVLLNAPLGTGMMESNIAAFDKICRQVRSQLILALPYFCNPSNTLQLIWPRDFSYVEKDAEDYGRWFSSRAEKKASLVLYNHSAGAIRAEFTADIFSWDSGATFRIRLPGDDVFRGYTSGGVSIRETLVLQPGANELAIEYQGNIHNADEGDIRPLQFRVGNVHVRPVGDDPGGYSQDELFGEVFRTEVYRYCAYEELTRGVLHSAGFYEVQTYKSFERTGTAFEVCSRQMVSDARYYILDEQPIPTSKLPQDDLGLLVFVARRKGTYHG